MCIRYRRSCKSCTHTSRQFRKLKLIDRMSKTYLEVIQNAARGTAVRRKFSKNWVNPVEQKGYQTKKEGK